MEWNVPPGELWLIITRLSLVPPSDESVTEGVGTGPTPGRGHVAQSHGQSLASSLVLSPNGVTHPDTGVAGQC